MRASWPVSSADLASLPTPVSTRYSANQTDPDFDLVSLNRIASRISSATPLQDVLNEVVEFVSAAAQCDSCTVYLLEGDDLVLRASVNLCPEVVNRLKIKAEQGVMGWAAQQREPVVIERDAYEDRRFQLFNETPGDRFEAFLSIPVVIEGKQVGAINAQNRAAHSFSSREINLIAMLGCLVGAAAERARLADENLHLSERLESRKIIERAKGILQRDLVLSEEDAYLTLQRESRQRRKTMKEVAEAVILSEDLKKQK